MACLRLITQSQNLNSTNFIHHHHHRFSYQQQQHRLNFTVTKTNALTNSDPSKTLLDSNKTQVFDAVPILSCSQAYERLKTFREKVKGKQQYLAMYSSIFGGITTDPAAMVIPMDDHMVHRGHGVFDTAAILDGHLYELDQHLDRFLNSASRSKIDPPFDRDSIRRILIQTVSASKCRKGSLRYWLSAGPGDFQLSPSGCHQSGLYAIVIQDLSLAAASVKSKGVKVITSSIPIKHPMFAITKSVNYLPNVLSKMEADEAGAFAGIWLDDEGFVAEGPNMNVAFVTKEKELIMPHFDKILSGCTAKRVLTLAECLLKQGELQGIRMKNVTVEEGKKANEMMLIGSGVLVCPVVQWDDQVIGDGKEGHITQALLNLIVEDMKSSPPTVRTPLVFAGIWLDDEGFVAEGPNMNVTFVTKEKELKMPHFDKIQSGCTAKRVLTLAECFLKQGELQRIRMKNVTVEEGKKANEMMLIGSGVLVCPVVQWDDQVIGDGE